MGQILEGRIFLPFDLIKSIEINDFLKEKLEGYENEFEQNDFLDM
jgi:hypothetical protein